MTADLLQRWQQLALTLKLGESRLLGVELVARYCESHRRYHDPAHLAQVLDLLDECSADPRLSLAAWFHDAIYQPCRTDNEQASATLARSHLSGSALSSADIDFVAHAVLATAPHANASLDHDARFDLLIDADLAILGAPAAGYRHYRSAIRGEFSTIPQHLFSAGRAAFLRAMLAQRSIFRTQAFQRRFETQARDNLRQELGQLEARQ